MFRVKHFRTIDGLRKRIFGARGMMQSPDWNAVGLIWGILSNAGIGLDRKGGVVPNEWVIFKHRRRR
jgi:hypothetical protein